MEPAETSDGSQRPLQVLFDLIDRDKDGHLDLKEVAALFKRLAPDRSTRSAYNAAVEALLLTDSNIDRKLDRTEFQELLNRLAGVAGISSSTAAHRLFTAATHNHDDSAGDPHGHAATVEAGPTASQDDQHHQDDKQVPALPSSAVTAVSAPAADPAAPIDQGLNRDGQHDHQETIIDAKLQRLFGLWDRSGDGSISFDELCQGLAKLMQLKGKQDITSLLSEAARILSRHDTTGDRRLQYDEFTMFLVKFMWAAGFRLVDILDELIMLAQKRDSKKIRVVVDNAQPQIDSLLSEAGN